MTILERLDAYLNLSQCYHAAEAVMATITRRAATEEDLLKTPRDGHIYELVDGEIRMSPAGVRHGGFRCQLREIL